MDDSGEWGLYKPPVLDTDSIVVLSPDDAGNHGDDKPRHELLASDRPTLSFSVDLHELEIEQEYIVHRAAQLQAELDKVTPPSIELNLDPQDPYVFHRHWTDEVDIIVAGSYTYPASAFGDWDVQDLQRQPRPTFSVRIKEDLTNASYAQLSFGPSVDRERATLVFPLQTTELHRTGLGNDQPTNSRHLKDLRKKGQWNTSTPTPSIITSNIRHGNGLNCFIIKAEKKFVSSIQLSHLSDNQARVIAAALDELQVGSQTHIEILCIHRSLSVSQKHLNNGDRSGRDLRECVIPEWNAARVNHLNSIASGQLSGPYDIGIPRAIIIQWDIRPWNAAQISWGSHGRRRDAIPPLYGSFSVSDFLHRTVGGVLARVRQDVVNADSTKKVIFDARVLRYSQARFLLLLRPHEKVTANLVPGSRVKLLLEGARPMAYGEVDVEDAMVHMQGGDILLSLSAFHGARDEFRHLDATFTTSDAIMEEFRLCPRISARIEVGDSSYALLPILQTLECLSHRGLAVRDIEEIHDIPILSWDREYHPCLLRQAACRRSFFLQDASPRALLPLEVVERLKLRFKISDHDFIEAVEQLSSMPPHKESGIQVALLEGRAGVGKTYFLAVLILELLSVRWRIHFSAPANVPIDELVFKLRALHSEAVSGMPSIPTTKSFFVIRGHPESMEFRHFRAVVDHVRGAYHELLVDNPRSCFLQSLPRDAALDADIWSRGLYSPLPDAWNIAINGTAADEFHSLSRTLLRSLGLAAQPSTLTSHTSLLRAAWNAVATPLLRSIHAFIIQTPGVTSLETAKTLQIAYDAAVVEIITAAGMLATTPVTGTSPLYRRFRATLAIFDEANKGSIDEWLSLSAHVKPSIMILCGDRRQLRPSSVVDQVKRGYRDCEVSPFEKFACKGLPRVALHKQRRAAFGLFNPPYEVFYGPSPPVSYVDGALDYSQSGHGLTAPVGDAIEELLQPTPWRPVLFRPYIFLDTSGDLNSASRTHKATKSKINLGHLPIGVAMAVTCARIPGVCTTDIAIISQYKQQLLLYTQALANLMAQDTSFEDAAIDLLKIRILTVDKSEGVSVKIAIFDLVVTSDSAFSEEPSRLLVAVTRATDFQIIIGQSCIRSGPGLMSPIHKLYHAYDIRRAVHHVCETDSIRHTNIGHIDPGELCDEGETDLVVSITNTSPSDVRPTSATASPLDSSN